MCHLVPLNTSCCWKQTWIARRKEYCIFWKHSVMSLKNITFWCLPTSNVDHPVREKKLLGQWHKCREPGWFSVGDKLGLEIMVLVIGIRIWRRLWDNSEVHALYLLRQVELSYGFSGTCWWSLNFNMAKEKKPGVQCFEEKVRNLRLGKIEAGRCL